MGLCTHNLTGKHTNIQNSTEHKQKEIDTLKNSKKQYNP